MLRPPGSRITGWGGVLGATSQRIAAAAPPIAADVLVIAIALTDERRGVPFRDTTVNIDKMVKTVNASRVIVAGLAPLDAQSDEAAKVDGQFAQLASQRGWTYTEAAAGVRNGNTYKDSTSSDGISPNAVVAKIIGEALRAAILLR